MGWHTAGILLDSDEPDSIPAFLTDLGFAAPRSGATVDGEYASSFELQAVAVASRDGWSLFFNSPDLFGSGELPELPKARQNRLWPASVEQALEEYSKRCWILSFLMESACNCYGFASYEHGQRHRFRLLHHGNLRFDRGSPLSGERGIFRSPGGDDEESILILLGHLCPVFNDLLDSQFQVYTYLNPPG